MKLQGPGISLMPAPPVAHMLRDTFADAVRKWGEDPHHRPHVPSGEANVRAAIEALNDAITKLGKRTGARADAARSWLTGHRDRLAKALEAWQSVGANLDGAAIVDIAKRSEATRAAERDANRAFELASPAKVREARDAIDVVEATQRELMRDTTALLRSVAYPAIPDLRALTEAKNRTAELAHAIKGAKPASALHHALDQGRDASADVARLWIVYEPATEHQAFTLRCARHAEGVEPVAAPAPSAEQLAKNARDHEIIHGVPLNPTIDPRSRSQREYEAATAGGR